MNRGTDYIGLAATAVILNDNNEILLLQRNKAPEAGNWSVPGGAVEFGETMENALKRELREELGIEIEIIKPLTFTDHIPAPKSTHWVVATFLAKVTSGEVINKEPEKHQQLAWFSPTDIPTNSTSTTISAVKSIT